MPLPELIEIVPLDKPVRAEITVPGSKSITNRALILGALAEGEVTLEGALWSEDTQVMVEALRKLGFEITVEPDADELCNRRITVRGQGGRIPKGGTPEKPLELFVGNAGTAARFLAAFVCLGQGAYRLWGAARMHERPQAALFQALRELGYRVESPNSRLPVVIHKKSEVGGQKSEAGCAVSIAESSQFASALLLCARAGGWAVRVEDEDAEESSYVEMTKRLVAVFPTGGGRFAIEPDASSGSYFIGADWLVAVGAWMTNFLKETPSPAIGERFHALWDWIGTSHTPGKPPASGCREARIEVRNWPRSGWQIDGDFADFIPLPDQLSRQGQLGDSILTSMVLAADLWGGVGRERREKGVRFIELGRLRVQECERVTAMRTELTRCGAKVAEEGEGLTIFQSELHGAEIETYNDHRMAMCFAILGLKVPGIRIHNPACVKKTFPNFFQKFAASPPGGLGATILDARSRRKLEGSELFAD